MIRPNRETSGTALSAGMVNHFKQWIVDIGATNHMVSDPRLLSNTRSFLNSSKGDVMLPTGNTAKMRVRFFYNFGKTRHTYK